MREHEYRAWHTGVIGWLKPQMLYDEWPGQCLKFKHESYSNRKGKPKPP